MFIKLLISIIHKMCVSVSNQKCEIEPTFINLHLNEYSLEFHYYPFTVVLDKWVGSCQWLI